MVVGLVAGKEYPGRALGRRNLIYSRSDPIGVPSGSLFLGISYYYDSHSSSHILIPKMQLWSRHLSCGGRLWSCWGKRV